MNRKIHKFVNSYTFTPGEDTRDIDIIIMRYGLVDHQPKTLEEVAKKFKLSKQ